MSITIIIEKELEDWWGVEDLLVDMPNATDDEKRVAVIELLMEDLPAVIDGAKWSVELSNE